MDSKVKLLLLAAALTAISCGSPDKKTAGGEGTAVKYFNGRAVITEIIDSTEGSGGRNYVEIYFNFIPAEASAAKNYLCRQCPDKRVKLFYDNRESFHSNWVKKWGIEPGCSYPAVRHDMKRNNNSTEVTYEVLLEPKKE